MKKIQRLVLKSVMYVSLVLGLTCLGTPAQADTCLYNTPAETYTPPTTVGTKYYIDGTNGSDSYDGLAPSFVSGTRGPWKTFAKAFNRYTTRQGGAQFLIRAGKYYERFQVPNTWSYGTDDAHRIVIAPYGDGEVILDGSVTKNLGAWSLYSGSIYRATFSVAPVNGLAALVIDENFRSYRPVASLVDVTGPGLWFYDTATLTLYVWPAAEITGSPSGHDVVAVENDVDGTSKYGITLQPGANYVTIGGLTVRGNPGANIFADGVSPYNNRITIEQCKVEFSAKSGVWINHATNAVVAKNYIFGNVLRNWPRGNWASTCSYYTAGGWPPALAFVSNTNHLAQGNIVSWSNGEGIIFIDNGAFGNGLATNNIVHDSYSTNMYFDHGVNSTFSNNFVYSSDPQDSDIRSIGCTASDIQGLKRRSRAAGIASANEAYASLPAIGSGNRIFNNIVVGTRRGISTGDETTGGGLHNENILNNTVIVPDYDATLVNDSITGISIAYNAGNNLNSTVKNNIVVATHPSTTLVTWEASGNPNDSGVTWDNNLYYHSANSTPFLYKGGKNAFASWITATGQDLNGQHNDPALSRSDWSVSFAKPAALAGTCRSIYDEIGVSLQDFMPQLSSPAIGAAVISSLFSSDFAGAAKSVPWTAGALDAGSSTQPADSIAPVVSVSAPIAGASVAGTVSVSAAATDNVGVTSVEFYVNGALAGTSSAAPFGFTWQTTQLANGSYTLSAKAYDAAGNVGQSAAVGVTVNNVIPDTTAPLAGVSAPVAGATLSGSVSIAASASDNVGVARVDFYLNSTLIGSAGAAPYSLTWDSTSVANGAYSLSVKAYDAAGNVGTSSAVLVNVLNDLAAPVVSLTAPGTGSTLSQTVFLSASAVDDIGVTRVEFYLNGALQGTVSSSPYTVSWNTLNSANGSYTVTARAYDASGKVGISSFVTVTVFNDTAAPTVAIASPGAGSTLSQTATVQISASDNVGVTKVEYYLNGILQGTATASPYSFTWNTLTAVNGSYTLTAKAYDAAGNVGSSTPVTVSVFNDLQAPAVGSFTLPANANSTTVAVSALVASDNVGVTGYLITESATAPSAAATGWKASAPTSFSFAGTGLRTAYAWAKDAAGNVSSAKSASVLIDTTLPTIKSMSLSRSSGTVNVKASATDNVGVTRFQLYLDGVLKVEVASGSLSSTLTVSSGSHTATVKAYDAAGNTRSQSVNFYR